MLLYQILAFAIHRKIYKKSYKNNKFEISAPTWNEKLQLPDGSYSVSVYQEYFEYIIKKHETVINNPSIKIYLNKIGKKIRFFKKRITS